MKVTMLGGSSSVPLLLPVPVEPTEGREGLRGDADENEVPV